MQQKTGTGRLHNPLTMNGGYRCACTTATGIRGAALWPARPPGQECGKTKNINWLHHPAALPGSATVMSHCTDLSPLGRLYANPVSARHMCVTQALHKTAGPAPGNRPTGASILIISILPGTWVCEVPAPAYGIWHQHEPCLRQHHVCALRMRSCF